MESLKNYLSFWLTFLCILGALGLAYTKGLDITMLLPSLLGIYITNRTAEKASAHWAASKDQSADTEKVIEMISGSK
jgi:hypothetical protein